MEYRIGLIHGDGIGPEIVKEAKKVLDKRNEVMYNSNVPPEAACTL